MSLSLAELARQYTSSHERILSPAYELQFRTVVASYRAFLGGEPQVSHLSRELLNAYLAWLLDCGRSPWTAKGRRAVLLLLARYAAAEGLLAGVPQPKRVRCPRILPRCWTAEEIRRLVAAAQQLPGRFPRIDVQRGRYMSSLIIGLYDTGFRLGDALMLGRRQIASDGTVTARQSKTGREIVRRFSRAALAEIDASGAQDRPLIWPLWSARERLYRVVRILVARAEIPRGTLRWLRRSGVTAVVQRHGLDAGRRFADHVDASTTLEHYIDVRQLGDVPQPPPLF